MNKRENFRQVYDGFDVEKVATYGAVKIQELLADRGIIRNRAKIEASITNAKVFRQIQTEFGSFDCYIWSFTEGRVIVESYADRTTSPLSDLVSRELKKRGTRFIGSTIIYSYLQAIGVINGHGRECDYHKMKKEEN